MPTTRGHTSVRHLIKLANVDMSPIPPKLRLFLDVDIEDEWMRARKKEWDGMMRWKELRRWGMNVDYDYSYADREEGNPCGDDVCEVPLPTMGMSSSGGSRTTCDMSRDSHETA